MLEPAAQAGAQSNVVSTDRRQGYEGGCRRDDAANAGTGDGSRLVSLRVKGRSRRPVRAR